MTQAPAIRQLVAFILEECRKQNLSQRDLAERSGIGQATISRMISGQTDPTMSSLEAIAKGLGYSLVSFLLLAAESITGFRDAEMMSAFSELTERDRELVLTMVKKFKDTPASERR